MVPKATLVAVLWHPNTRPQLEAARDAARGLKVELLPIEVSLPEAMPAAFETAVKGRAQALIVTMDPFFFGQSKEMSALALKRVTGPVPPLRDVNSVRAGAAGRLTGTPGSGRSKRERSCA